MIQHVILLVWKMKIYIFSLTMVTLHRSWHCWLGMQRHTLVWWHNPDTCPQKLAGYPLIYGHGGFSSCLNVFNIYHVCIIHLYIHLSYSHRHVKPVPEPAFGTCEFPRGVTYLGTESYPLPPLPPRHAAAVLMQLCKRDLSVSVCPDPLTYTYLIEVSGRKRKKGEAQRRRQRVNHIFTRQNCIHHVSHSLCTCIGPTHSQDQNSFKRLFYVLMEWVWIEEEIKIPKRIKIRGKQKKMAIISLIPQTPYFLPTT